MNENTKKSGMEKAVSFTQKHSEIWKFIKFTFTGTKPAREVRQIIKDINF